MVTSSSSCLTEDCGLQWCRKRGPYLGVHQQSLSVSQPFYQHGLYGTTQIHTNCYRCNHGLIFTLSTCPILHSCLGYVYFS
ncbi:hypothetical protein J4Q44_G00295370 [Coregonus suidteri]|uniref:Uncharacterized protein n=1 Tax=Coregonus suidteri TaxID=861788 RepID=A0AAN8L275_9TELE